MNDKWIVHDFDQAPERSPRLSGRGPSQLQPTRPERRSFNGALLVSVLLHGLLLSQLVGGDGQGFTGLVLPWQQRRIEVPDVQVVLAPLPAPAPPAPPVPRLQEPVAVDAPAVPAPVPSPKVPAEARPSTAAAAVPVSPLAPPRPAVPDLAPPPLPSPPSPPSPAPPVLTAEPSEVLQPIVPAESVVPTLANTVEPSASASSPDPVSLAMREAALQVQRLEAERQETARRAAAKLEAQRLEAVRQAEVRAEAAQQQEAARQAAVRAEVARLEAERQETARKAAAQQEAARAQAALQQQEAVAKREALLRAIGRQLDEENARRDAAANANAVHPPGTLPRSLSTARRARLWGHTDTNTELVAYAQAWALKLQLNTLPDRVREVTRRPHTPPTVTVALRSDGSVESVAFVVSSGVPEVDDAIRRMVEAQRPYAAFPPALARLFDVVEIRRTWYFDSAVRLH